MISANEVIHWNSVSYPPKYFVIKTTWLGIALDSIIPMTFGLITFFLKLIYGKYIRY